MKNFILIMLLLIGAHELLAQNASILDTSQWKIIRQSDIDSFISREKLVRNIQIYAYGDSVTIIDSPFTWSNDTFRYIVETWFYYEIGGKGVRSVGRGQSSNEYSSYMEYINRDMLWEIWMDRDKRDYWLYSYGSKRRISFKSKQPQRAFLTITSNKKHKK